MYRPFPLDGGELPPPLGDPDARDEAWRVACDQAVAVERMWSRLEHSLGMLMRVDMRIAVKDAVDKFLEERMVTLDASRRRSLRGTGKKADELKLSDLPHAIKKALSEWRALQRNPSAATLLDQIDIDLRGRSGGRYRLTDAMDTLRQALPMLRYATEPAFTAAALQRSHDDEQSELADASSEREKSRIRLSRSTQREAITRWASFLGSSHAFEDGHEAELMRDLHGIVKSFGGNTSVGGGYESGTKSHRRPPNLTPFVRFARAVSEAVNIELPEGAKLEHAGDGAWVSAIKKALRSTR